MRTLTSKQATKTWSFDAVFKKKKKSADKEAVALLRSCLLFVCLFVVVVVVVVVVFWGAKSWIGRENFAVALNTGAGPLSLTNIVVDV